MIHLPGSIAMLMKEFMLSIGPGVARARNFKDGMGLAQ